MVEQQSHPPFSQDAWVIKLDSIGCEYPFCDTTVGLLETEFAERQGLGV